MSTWVWVDGNLSPSGDARVAALDHGLTVGDGVFETCKVVHGTPFALTRHLARLRRSAEIIGLRLAWSDDDLRAASEAAIGAASIDAANATVGVERLRITITGGPGPLGSDRSDVPPTLVVAAGPGSPWPPITQVVTVPWTRNERSAVAGAKTTSYAENVVALAEAHRHGASEALLANTVGLLSEGTGSNIFLELDGLLCTPSLASGCLPGITRALVCAAVDVVERDDLTLDDLVRTSEAFLTSSTRDVHPIDAIDGRPLPAPGPLTAEAVEAFASLQARTLDPA
ncbi:MAG: aminotransferase [Ilumatobacteraceae bacterium]|nr:aminotransferase [Ilumatobacteraceae bacterium]